MELDAVSRGLTYSPAVKQSRSKKPWVSNAVDPPRQALHAEKRRRPSDPKFDEYFNSLPKVHYKDCSIGFHLENEFPYWTTNMPYSKNLEYGDGSKTSDESGGKRLKARDYRMVAWYDVMSTE